MKQLKYLILIFGLAGSSSLKAQPDEGDLLYEAVNTPLRDIYLIQNSSKIVTLKQERGMAPEVYLLNKENLFTDTLGQMFLHAVYPLPNGRVLLQALDSITVFELRGNRIRQVRTLPFCRSVVGLRALFFHDMLVTAKTVGMGKKRRPLVEITILDTAGIRCIPGSGNAISLAARSVFPLKDKLVHDLPFIMGLGGQEMGVFIRDTQELYLLSKDSSYALYQLPFTKEQVWSYRFDWQSGKHYLIRTSNNQFALYQLRNNYLSFVQTIHYHPTQIVGDKIIYCDGSIKSNCDFYAETILPAGNKEQIFIKVIIGRIKND